MGWPMASLLTKRLVAAAALAVAKGLLLAAAGCGGLPSACEGTSPFEDAECGRALATACGELADAEDCDAHAGFDFGSGNDFLCVWANVARVQDVSTCATLPPIGRCVAAANFQYPDVEYCFDPCDDRPDDLDALLAIPSASELVRIPCGGPQILGPVGEWSTADYGFGEGYLAGCLEAGGNQPPEICSCTAQACAAF